jgi:hypothetical protein
MNTLIVKVKNKDLYFNADEMEGPYVCKTPMLLSKEEADSIIKYCDELYSYENFDESYKSEDLEIKTVEIKIID